VASRSLVDGNAEPPPAMQHSEGDVRGEPRMEVDLGEGREVAGRKSK